jgi:hypothetical protein
MKRNRQQQSGGWLWRAIAAGVMVAAPLVCRGQVTNVAVTPSADAFVRSLAPGSNYGAAGALSVSGWAAVNGAGQQNGLFDSLIRFSMSNAAASLNGSFGSNGWVVTGATLVVTEVGAPNNAIFNRGVGALEIRWIGSGAWVEGTGTPNTPTADGVAYQDLPSVLTPAADVSLGQFTNSGVSGVVSFPLTLVEVLVSNIVAGSDLNLYLTAASASVGFTFDSRNFATPSAWPSLEITAVAKPLVRITSIERLGANQVALRFNTASNWTYVVQGLDGLGAATTEGWSNLFTVAAKPLDDQAVFVDVVASWQRFYRLSVSR